MKPDIKKISFKPGLSVEFEILTISDLYCHHKDLVTSPQRADFYQIFLIQKGTPTHFVDFKPMPLEENTMLFVPKHCVNHFDFTGDYEGKIIIFTDDFFCKNHDDMQFIQSTILFNDLYEITKIHANLVSSDLSEAVKAMEIELSKPNDYAQHNILRNQLRTFLLLAEREKRKQGFKEIKASADLDYVLLFKDLLDKNFKADKSVSKYASDISISEKRLNKATTAILDQTPKQLIDGKVLLEAKRLLAYGISTIKEISIELGFEEPTNFIKYFRKHTNTTPSEFRESYQ